MIAGKLNNLINSSVTVTGLDNQTRIEPLENGNPIKNQRLKLWWTQVHSMRGIDVHLYLDGNYWINSLVLNLSDDCEAERICAYNKTKEALLCQYSGETGKFISDRKVILPVECEEDEIILSFEATEANIVSIENIDVYGFKSAGNFLYPQVNEFNLCGDGSISPEILQSVSADCETANKAVNVLKEKFSELTNKELAQNACGDIKFNFDNNVETQGYTLTIDKSGVKICASDERGFVYGAEVFLKLMRWGEIPFVSIKDKPNTKLRGIHMYLPPMNEIDFFKRFIKYIASPLGYNTIIIELGGAFEFKRHPEINEGFEMANEKAAKGEWPPFPHGGVGGKKTIKQEVVRDLVEYIQSFGMEAVPEVQSFSHVEYLTVTYPEIAEVSDEAISTILKDGRSDFYNHDYCPSNPKTYEIMFDLLEEVLEVFAPCKLVHMGHDELKKVGVCPLCKGKDPAEIYAQDIWKYRNFLAERGAKMMFWADAVSSISRIIPFAKEAIKKIPKDVILLDFIWYVYPCETEDALLAHDMTVAIGNFYSSHHQRSAERLAKPGMIGGEISTWTVTKEQSIAAEGKMYDIFYLSQILWSKDYNPLLRYAYDRVIQKEIASAREKIQNKEYPSLHKNYSQKIIEDKGAFNPENTTGGAFEINDVASSLVFEHTATDYVFRTPWTPFENVGKYVISYADGKREEIELTYTGNISYWNRRFGEPFKGRYYRHNGYIGAMWYTSGIEGRLPDGKVYTLYRYEWINPNPQSKILSVEFVHNDSAKTNVIINKLIACKKEI
ncbi:MAG: family 20 glycosylhydrolase [Clostridia bacterium]|nr:family 20 glycosylhydrolase [Clostridia bacterium]